MEFTSAREAADKYGIDNTVLADNMLIIPTTALKPADAKRFRYMQNGNKKAKPFLKWAGSETQVISKIEKKGYYLKKRWRFMFGDGI